MYVFVILLLTLALYISCSFAPTVEAIHLLFPQGRSMQCFRINQPSGTAVTMSWFVSEKVIDVYKNNKNSGDTNPTTASRKAKGKEKEAKVRKGSGSFRVHGKEGYNGNGKLELETTSSSGGNGNGEKVNGNSGKFLASQELDTTQGMFRFATVNDKAHSICLESPYLEEESGVEIEIEYGLSEDYYTELYRKSNVEPLEAHLMKLNSKMSEVLSEADYMKDKEVMFHQQCERTNKASQIWPILQVSILVFTGYIQVRSLKNFFKSKKLI